MNNATQIDLPRSASAYQAAHQDWAGAVAKEAFFLERLRPDLVLTNVSYLPLAGAALAGIPSISLCSLNWADLFAHFFGDEAWANPIHAEMLAAYRSARHFLRITPGMPMAHLGNARDIAPIAHIGQQHNLGLSHKKTVLIAMGGISHHIPVDNWPRLTGVHWLVSEKWRCTHPDAINYESFGLSFTDLLCSVDAIITKPGYGTFTEAACNGIPVIYLRREDWPEQDDLVRWLHQHATANEISADLLITGKLTSSLELLWKLPRPKLPEPLGAQQAAIFLFKVGKKKLPH